MANEGDAISVKPVESIARVELWTDAIRAPSDWELCCYFEGYLSDHDGNIRSVPTFGKSELGVAEFRLRFGDIAAETVDVDGKTYSVTETAAVIKAFCYKFLADTRAKRAKQQG